MLSEILIPISFFAATAVVLWKFFDSRHRIRMMIIERGLIDENLKYLFGSVTSQPNRYSTLKWGLVALFIGAALLVVIPLQQFAWAQYHEGELITGIIFLAGGLAFLLYYGIVSKREKAEKS
ncbi:MAG: DUF6249 domain-containing protein [Bacteroidota bacterium]|nr:DUF6249 domain-containing protein [Bacteroidota bacterium]